MMSVSLIAQNSVNLKLNLEKNKVYRLRSTSEQIINQTINGNQQTNETASDYSLSLKMLDATADFIVTEIHIDTMIIKTNAMGKTINLTSAVEGNLQSTESSDVMSCIMNRLSKNALYVKFEFTGKVIEVLNAKMLSDAILKDTSSIALTGPTALAVKKQIGEMVSAGSLKTIIEMFTYNLPAKQVTTGDSWDINVTTTTGGMTLDINTNYHLDGIKGNSANLTVNSDIKTALNAAPIISGPAKVTYDDLKGLSKATMSVDTNTGLVVEYKAKTHISGNLGISGPGFSMTMPMDINSDSKTVAF
jgi:hypothetical protein